MSDRPVNRCAIKACPVVGYWPEGDTCPLHRGDPPRRPTLAEAWETDPGGQP